uniref:N-acetyltransferase domain-containing protein n=1 Tax=Meloidogyne incognita TaxID=6306 RepID=A0A914L252_MELIC
MYFQEIRNGPYIGLDNANRLFSFLEMVENDLNLILKNEKCVLKLEIISVHPILGLASNLLKKSIEIARVAECSHIITSATAVASQNLFKKFGFKTVHKVLFNDFLEDGEPVFKNLHDNGSGAELMLYKLE